MKRETKFDCSGFKIVVLDRGFVYVGDVTTYPNGIIVENAKNIRVWGTKSGLGQLAKEGPTSNTVLDYVGTILAPSHAIQHFIVTDSTKWNR